MSQGDDDGGGAGGGGRSESPPRISSSEPSPLEGAVQLLSGYGGVIAQVQVLHAFWLADKSLLFIGHSETEFAVMRSQIPFVPSACEEEPRCVHTILHSEGKGSNPP